MHFLVWLQWNHGQVTFAVPLPISPHGLLEVGFASMLTSLLSGHPSEEGSPQERAPKRNKAKMRMVVILLKYQMSLCLSPKIVLLPQIKIQISFQGYKMH